MISKGKRKGCYTRDGYKCVKCGSPDDLTIDHVIPKSMGGKDHLRNLQTMCKTCNQKKGNQIVLYAKYRSTKSYLVKQLQMLSA